jgi:hypothetical protein
MARKLIYNPLTHNFDWVLLGAANAFSTMQPDNGTAPVADSTTDTLTFTSSDSTVTITGDSVTDTLDFVLTDPLVKISANDTTFGYLNGKLTITANGGLALTEVNDGSNETLNVTLDINNTTDLATPAIGDELLISDIDNGNAIRKADVASVVNLADHDALTNYVANEHVDHSTVNIATAALTSGLSGGGDITATRNLIVDINGTTAKTDAVDADELLISDSAAAHVKKKITIENFSKLYVNADEFYYYPTGYINGLVMSINGGDNTKIDYTEGVVEFVDVSNPLNPTHLHVTVPAGTTASAPNTRTQSLMYVESGGSVIFRAFESIADRLVRYRDEVNIGSSIHPSGTVTGVNNALETVTMQVGNSLLDLGIVLGPLNVEGNVYGDHDGTLALAKTVGKGFSLGVNAKTDSQNPNIISIPAETPSTFFYTYQDGASSWTEVSGQTALVPGSYDDGDGTLGSVAAAQYTIQRIFLTATTTVVQYGQTVYNTKASAVADLNTESWARNPNLSGTLFRASVVLRGNATDLSDLNQAEFFEFQLGTSAGGSAQTTDLQTAYDNSANGSTPEIELDSTRGGLTIRDASSPIGTPLFEVENNGGTECYFCVEASQVTINVDGADVDFLVKGDNDALLINTDAANDKVGIGVVPSWKFQVQTADDTTGIVHSLSGNAKVYTNLSSGNGQLYLRDSSGNDDVILDGGWYSYFLNGIAGYSTASSNLTLASTDNSTKGKVFLGTAQTTAFDEVNQRFGVNEASPDARLEVSTATDEGIQAVTIDQNDADKAFIDYQGTSAASAANNISTWTTGNSIQGFIRVEINGVEYWMPFYDVPTA